MHRRVGLGLAGLFLLFVTTVHAQNPFDALQQFSASVSGGPMKWEKKKIYRSGKLMRGEYESEDEVRISNQITKNGWVIRPRVWTTKPKECERMSLLDALSYPFLTYGSQDFDVKPVPAAEGVPAEVTETIDGHSCRVHDYTLSPKGDKVLVIKAKLWEADDLKGFPVKIEIQPVGRAKFTLSYTDVSVGPPDPKLFQLPALCTQKKKAPATAPASKSPAKPAPKK